MTVKVIKAPFSEWERVEYPTYAKGTAVVLGEKAPTHFCWYAAEIEGRDTYIPGYFVTDGKLSRDYNPTELDAKIGDILQVKEIHTVWLLAQDEAGNEGWIMSECVTSEKHT